MARGFGKNAFWQRNHQSKHFTFTAAGTATVIAAADTPSIVTSLGRRIVDIITLTGTTDTTVVVKDSASTQITPRVAISDEHQTEQIECRGKGTQGGLVQVTATAACQGTLDYHTQEADD